MRNRIRLFLDKLRSSYWFIPSILVIVAMVTSIITVRIDEILERELSWVTSVLYINNPDGAREVLSTIASSMITVAGVVFSLTMVVLSLTSQQYGPLVIRNFIRDRGNQVVLGTFTATFVYCLLILRTVRGMEDNTSFVPHISLLIGLGLALLSLAVLIYFIHHVSDSIQASNIISQIGDNLNQAVDDWFPNTLGQASPTQSPPDPAAIARFEQHSYPVSAVQTGYIQAIDEERLINLATKHQLVIEIVERPGAFLMEGSLLLRINPRSKVTTDITESLINAFVIGKHRTQTQDIEFIMMQLVAIAVRTLSPGINDPFTALMCLNRLGDALCRIAQCETPSAYRYDKLGQLRVIAHPVTFKQLFAFAFDQIRYYGRADLQVMIRLIELMAILARCSPPHRPLLAAYAEQLYREAIAATNSLINQKRLQEAFDETRTALEG